MTLESNYTKTKKPGKDAHSRIGYEIRDLLIFTPSFVTILYICLPALILTGLPHRKIRIHDRGYDPHSVRDFDYPEMRIVTVACNIVVVQPTRDQ